MKKCGWTASTPEYMLYREFYVFLRNVGNRHSLQCNIKQTYKNNKPSLENAREGGKIYDFDGRDFSLKLSVLKHKAGGCNLMQPPVIISSYSFVDVE